MAGEDRWPERIRALIDQVDRVRRDSERMTSHAERSMKSPFWPDRRRSPRMPVPDQPDDNADTP